MVKPEWGTKRLCLSCGAQFYDLRRQSVVCPKCDAPYQAPAPAKSRRGAAPQAAPVEVAPAKTAPDVTAEPKAPVAAEGGGLKTPDDDADNGKAEDFIKDASKLGEDEVAEVIDSSRTGDES